MKSLLNNLERLALTVSRFISNLSGIAVLWIIAITCVDVVGRYFFNSPLYAGSEMVQVSMAFVIFLSLPGLFFKNENIIVDLFPFFKKGYIGWVMGGTFLAISLKTPSLILFFSFFAFVVGLFFIFLRENLMENPKKISHMIKKLTGVIIGFFSVPLGIGGGSLMVPFMRTFGYDIRKSIGTAAAVGFLIALSGTITMITGGKIIDNINTPFSIGYINLLGFIVFVPVTTIMARIGAKAVYKIDKKLLSKIFGTFLVLVSIRSFFEYLSIN